MKHPTVRSTDAEILCYVDWKWGAAQVYKPIVYVELDEAVTYTEPDVAKVNRFTEKVERIKLLRAGES